MASKREAIEMVLGGRTVRVTSPSKIYFPAIGVTKKDLIDYYVAVGDGALAAIAGRPLVLKRFVRGITGDSFFQKRAPKNTPAWMRTAELRFPSGRTARELVVDEVAGLAWITNTGNIDLNVHPVRASDLERPDELRIDLDPGPGVSWDDVRAVAMEVRAVLGECDLVPFAKTSGSRGMHIHTRLETRWGFAEVKRAALAVAREVERRVPAIATSRWRKTERHGVFLDYNQNAKDRTVAAAYSVRPVADARVSAPLAWDDVPRCRMEDFTIATMVARYAAIGDLWADLDDNPGSLESLLELASRHEADGLTGPTMMSGPVIVVARAEREVDALAGLERWKARHPEASRHVAVADVLVDSMRGRSSTWTRIRIDLRHVPAALRPAAEPPDPDLDPGDWRLGVRSRGPSES